MLSGFPVETDRTVSNSESTFAALIPYIQQQNSISH